MARKIVLVYHADDPPDDRVLAFARQNGLDPVIRRPFQGDDLGDLLGDVLGDPLDETGPDVAGSVVFGGPFSVFAEDQHPFLHDEAAWIRACMARGIPLLGICQGAQQIARVLGASVGPHPAGMHEFGYYPVTATPEGRDVLPETLVVAQSHYHGFALPEGAVRLASSPLYPNQAFRFGTSTYGFQFHAETTMPGFRRWQDRDWAPYGKPGAQTRAEQEALMHAHDARQADWFNGFLARLFGTAE
jgi:GMP synthase (glutamine-hydrolysing)